jgi:PD-(D/E)XK endonuclease
MEKEPTSIAPDSDKFRNRRTAKRKGEAAEAAFLSKAAEFGFDVAKPWGDSAQFDFILHTGSRCWRVQVKSARERRKRRYTVKASGDHIAYTKDNIDFFVAYIVPENAWYVIPVEAINGRAGLWFYPHPGSKSLFEIYREAWCLMACPRDGRCSPEISVSRRCLASESGECRFMGGHVVSCKRRTHGATPPQTESPD